MNREPVALAALLEMEVRRMGHLEQLLLGLATLGVVGWGFIHGNPERGEFLEGEPGAVFALLFSGLVGSSYTVIFLGRMALNMNIIELETEMTAPVKPHTQYFARSLGAARLVFYVPASFMPVMSLTSIAYTGWTSQPLYVRVLAFFTGGVVLLAMLFTFVYVEKLMALVKEAIESHKRVLLAPDAHDSSGRPVSSGSAMQSRSVGTAREVEPHDH